MTTIRIIMLLLSILLIQPIIRNKTYCYLVEGKVTSGDFRLSGVNSDRVLSSFAIGPHGGFISITMHTGESLYPGTPSIRAYSDIVWHQYKKATTCDMKMKYAHRSILVDFQHIYLPVKNIKMWKSTNVFDINGKPQEQLRNRTYYWYFVVDDCSLEQYYQDDKVPNVHYDITLQNYLDGGHRQKTHFSADQLNLKYYHVIIMISSSIVLFRLSYSILMKLFFNKSIDSNKSSSSSSSSIHIAVLWIIVAAIFDLLSSCFEIIHLQAYSMNGIGMYAIDAMSAHCEAVCDALIILFLLAIGSGWTLPSSTFTVNHSSYSSNSKLTLLLIGLSKPISSLLSVTNIASLFGWIVLLLHIILAQWGRIYNDDYDSYHDYEHLPGKLLMFVRIIIGIIYWIVTYQTRLSCNSNLKLVEFYYLIGIIGFIWFISLPLLIWYCSTTWFISHYNKLPVVCIGSSCIQSISLLLLSWLVTGHSTIYHQYSHVTNVTEVSLADSLLLSASKNNDNVNIHPTNQSSSVTNRSNKGGPSTWSIGKTKVRLD